MNAEDTLGLAIPLTYFAMLAVEAVRPAREFPKVRRWRVVGVAAMLVLMTINATLPLVLRPEWLYAHRLVDGSRLGVPLGVVAGFGVVTLVTYAWHRLEHASDLVFRFVHQIHHSPVRMDLSGAAYLHPLDVAANVVVSLVVTLLVLGLNPLACAIVGYVGAVYAMFQHWNVRTPRWIGYLIQRPEAHGLHHERGVHARNYADLPLWDLVFGTFHGPSTFEGEVGFSGTAPRRTLAMLAGVDVERQVSP